MPEKNGFQSYEYLDSPQAVRQFISSLNDTPTIAVDTEGASFHRFLDRVYLIQLSARNVGAIIDPLAMETPPALGEMLQDPGVEVIFHDADYDLRLLYRDYGWSVTKLFDTRVAAQLLGIRSFGLGALLEQYFGIKLDKRFQRADWSMRPLTADMLDYAALDTKYLVDLRNRLADELDALGRRHWAEEEFRRIEGTRWESEASEDAFLRMKGARDLTRPQLAILRELVAWRDEVAAEMDRAVFRVIGNETLLLLAQSSATTQEEFGRVKGMPRGLFSARGAEITGAIERGRSTPADKMPRFPKSKRYDKDPQFDERVLRLKQQRDAAATRLGLDPGLLCSRERLEAIGRAMPTTPDELEKVDGVRRWQVEVLGEDFLRVLSTRD